MAAIDTTNPTTIFSSQNCPTTPGGTSSHLLDSSLIGQTMPTNQWWTNTIINDDSDPVFSYPYSFKCFLNTSPYGLGISYNYANASFSSVNPTQSAEYGATFNFSMNETFTSRTLMSSDDMGFKMRWYHDPTHYFETYLYRGQTTISIYCNNISPQINTGGGVALVNYSPAFSSNSLTTNYFTFQTNQTPVQNWSITTPSNQTWTYVSGSEFYMASPYTGWLFITFYPSTSNEATINPYVGAVVTGATVSPSIAGNTVNVNYSYTVSSQITGATTPLIALMAHHHANITGSPTAVSNVIYNCLQGAMYTYAGNSFSFQIPLIPTPSQYMTPPTGTKLTTITNQLAIDQSMTVTITAPYEGGKQMGALGTLVGIAELLGQSGTASSVRGNLKTGLTAALDSTGSYKLVYDPLWSGILTATDAYGNTNYNDHHFHWGYWLHAGGMLAKGDTSWFSTSSHQVKMNMLARDIGNPDPIADTHFPRWRHMDLYEFHSWAHGVQTEGDGKDQESNTEAINAYYGLALWGDYSSNAVAQQSGQILLSLEAIGTLTYYNLKYSSPMRMLFPAYNHTATLLFMGKNDYATFFDAHNYAIHGIHNFPITPVSPYAHLSDTAWTQQEYTELSSEIYAELTTPSARNSNSWYQFYIQAYAVNNSTDAWNIAQNFSNPDIGTSLTNIWTFIASSQYNVSQALNTGLCAYYKFDDGSGSSLNDSSVNGNTGTWQGTLGNQWTTGKISGAGNFNGTDNYITVPNSTTLLMDGSFTVMAWINYSAYATWNLGSPIVVKLSATGGILNYYLDIGPSGHLFVGFYDGSTLQSTNTTGGSVIPLNSWVFCAGVFDANNGTLTTYIDGTQNTQATSITTLPSRINPSNLSIGSQAPQANSYATGKIDELGLWNRALSASEIQYLYNSNVGLQYPFSAPNPPHSIFSLMGIGS